MGAQELSFPALLPREPYEATGRWTEYGDSIFRLQDRKGGDYLLGPTHEEMFTLVGEGPVLLLQGPAGLALPDPDEVPRRGASPRRRAPRPRVRHEGLLLLRHHRRGPRPVLRRPTARPTSRPSTGSASTTSSSRRPRGAMGGSKSEEFLAKADVGEDTYVRCTHCDYAANVEAVAGPAARARGVRRRARRARRGDARHPDDRDPRRPPQREVPARRPALGTPATPSRTSSSCSSTPTAPASRSRSACPATARSTRSASRASSSRSRSSRWTRPSFAKHPALVKGYIGPGVLGRGERVGDPLPRRPPRRRGHPLGDRRRRRPAATCSTSWPAATSRPTAPSRPPRCATATPARTATRARCESARGIEMGHIFQLGRKYADALDLQVLDENGKLVTVTMGSYGIGVSRAVAAIAEDTHDELGLCWPREVAPGRRPPRRRRQGRRDLRDRRPARRGALPPAASTCSTTTGRQGQPGREVQGRRADRRADDRHGRPGPGRRRGRGRGPRVGGAGRTSPVGRGAVEPASRGVVRG